MNKLDYVKQMLEMQYFWKLDGDTKKILLKMFTLVDKLSKIAHSQAPKEKKQDLNTTYSLQKELLEIIKNPNNDGKNLNSIFTKPEQWYFVIKMWESIEDIKKYKNTETSISWN